MKKQIENLINNAIDDFNSKWQSHEERNNGISEYAEKIMAIEEEKQALKQYDISQQHELLLAWEKSQYLEAGWNKSKNMVADKIDKYLAEKELRISDVMQQREQLFDFLRWYSDHRKLDYSDSHILVMIDKYQIIVHNVLQIGDVAV